ncbi:MAG: pyridoxamine 5'-phosphate oxidase family protein [Coriobacteriia bacterium]|nr:pyridoxamine 5'-phosphate oxidase family protein [Coriobacteriia bacterium]
MTDGHASAPMLRADRLVVDREAIDGILRRAKVLHLGMSGTDGPYVVPVNFGYDGVHIWIHCAEAGHKLDLLASDPRVCFEVSVDVRIVPGRQCGWGARFRSVVGFGTAILVGDAEEKAYGLGVLISQYSGESETVPVENAHGVGVLRIDISSMTGKAYVDE